MLDATKAVNAEPVDDSLMQIETNSNTNSMTRFARVYVLAISCLFADRFQLKSDVDLKCCFDFRALLLDFAASLMPGLAAKSVNVLFSYVKPAIKVQNMV